MIPIITPLCHVLGGAGGPVGAVSTRGVGEGTHPASTTRAHTGRDGEYSHQRSRCCIYVFMSLPASGPLQGRELNVFSKYSYCGSCSRSDSNVLNDCTDSGRADGSHHRQVRTHRENQSTFSFCFVATLTLSRSWIFFCLGMNNVYRY